MQNTGILFLGGLGSNPQGRLERGAYHLLNFSLLTSLRWVPQMVWLPTFSVKFSPGVRRELWASQWTSGAQVSCVSLCLFVEKANLTLGCISKSVACRLREEIFPLCSAPVRQQKKFWLDTRKKKIPSGMTVVKVGTVAYRGQWGGWAVVEQQRLCLMTLC